MTAGTDQFRPVPSQPGAGDTSVDWDRLAARARRGRWTWNAGIIGFLILASIPIILPYFWMVTISFSARTGGVESAVLWRAVAVLVPALVAFGVLAIFADTRRTKLIGSAAILFVAIVALILLVGADLHLHNYRFLWTPDVVEQMRGVTGVGGDQFPFVWEPFFVSLSFAAALTILIVTVATLAGYYTSRFRFPGRATFLQTALVLHAFPAMTLTIPIFLLMYWVGLLDTIMGVVLIVSTLELPFAIFIMKGFFDSVPWDIEMSALADGATRRQAFWKVVLPQVRGGMIAIGVFAFIKAWEEYVFVRTLLFEKSNWTMSLYLFWVSEDIMGVDYGIVAAVSVFYVIPSLILYIFCQRYLTQMTLGGIKG